jgi:hypothetical protein
MLEGRGSVEDGHLLGTKGGRLPTVVTQKGKYKSESRITMLLQDIKDSTVRLSWIICGIHLHGGDVGIS